MTITVFVCFLFAVLEDKSLPAIAKTVETLELKPEAEACVNELNLDKNEIKLLDSLDVVPEDNPKFEDFLGCYWQKMGWQDGNTGEIIFDGIKSLLRDTIAQDIGKELPLVRILVKQILLNVIDCRKKHLKGSSFGQTAAKVQNCLVTTITGLVQEDIFQAR